MNTDQLRYFMAIAHHKNFTEAAKEFYITQPAITHQIAALEKELGTPLFKRTTRSVTLTEAGKLFAEHAKHILDQEENALHRLSERTLSAFSATDSGRLHKSIPAGRAESGAGSCHGASEPGGTAAVRFSVLGILRPEAPAGLHQQETDHGLLLSGLHQGRAFSHERYHRL